MNSKIIVTAAAAFLLGAITTGVFVARAQTAGPPGGPPMPAPAMGVPGGPGQDGHGPWAGRGPGPWGDRMRERHAHRMELMRAFALIFHPEDRKLTPADVTKIAQGFLLWNGNHTWEVMHASPEGDVIGFDLATKEGAVIAHFTMDPKTGRLKRLG